MKKLLFILFAFVNAAAFSQVKNINEINTPANPENVSPVKLTDDSLATGFVIFVKTNVKLHKHAFHTEHVYILEGEGIMTLGDKTFPVKSGDFFVIPQNTPHSLKVTSAIPVKLISVQSPHFDGTDRIMLE